MIVKMFKSRFAPLVEDYKKRQTIRPVPKRMPKVGEEISLREWTGNPYRSPQRILRESRITHVSNCEITKACVRVNGCRVPSDHFAQADGFTSFSDMCLWFEETHGLPFEGILIEWI
jgi:hypothetical protein